MHLDLGPTTRASHRGASACDSVLLAHQMAAELNRAEFADDVKVQQDAGHHLVHRIPAPAL